MTTQTEIFVSKKKQRLNTQLILAVSSKDFTLADVERLLEKGANPNTRCRKSHLSVCHLAVYYGQKEKLEKLLEFNANPRARDKTGLQPHHLVAYNYIYQRSVECLKIILEKESSLKDSPVESPNPDDNPIPEDELDSFVHNHDETSKLVPENVPEGSTLLFIAAMRGHKQIIDKLLEFDADTNKAAKNNLTPLDVVGLDAGYRITGYSGSTTTSGLCIASGDIAKLLLKKGRASEAALQRAVIAGCVETVGKCLESVSPEGADEKGRTLIHLAVKNENKNERNSDKYNIILEMLLEKNTKAIDSQDHEGKTPFFLAVEGRWMADVEILLLKGADITVHSNDNKNVFHLVATQGNHVLLNELLGILGQEAHELINIRDNEGYTPLFRAVEGRHFSCIEKLLTYPALETYLVRNKEKRSTLLHSAVEATSESDINILKWTVNYILNGKKYIVSFFNERNDKDLTAVELAAELGKIESLKHLLSYSEIKSCFINSISEENKDTALHLAAKSGHNGIVEYLVDKYPRLLNRSDSEGRTALIVAALKGQEKCVYLLLSKGANLAVKDTLMNRTAIDVIMNYISNPLQMFEALLDSFVGENQSAEEENKDVKITLVASGSKFGGNENSASCRLLNPKRHDENQPDTDNFQVLLDYKCLVAGQRELEVIEAVSDCKFEKFQQQFFLHPLVRSFLFVKWKQVDLIFSVLSFIYIFHVVSVTGLALLFCDHPFTMMAWIFRAVIWLTVVPVIIMEVLNWTLNGKILSEVEMYANWLATATAVILSVSPEIWWGLYLASFAVLMSWIQLLLFYAMSPKWGLYILMFFEVVQNVCQVLSTFIFLIVGFALSFFILFKGRHPFPDLWSSLCEILSMMSELGYNDVFNEEYANTQPFKVFGRIMYLGFHLLVIMVLCNIILGMSVGDVNQLEGKSRHVAKLGSFINLMDKFNYNEKLISWLSWLFRYEMKNNFQKVTKYLKVYPNKRTSESNPLHKDLLYEIMTIISGRKSCSEDINSLAQKLRYTNRKIDEVFEQVQEIAKVILEK